MEDIEDEMEVKLLISKKNSNDKIEIVIPRLGFNKRTEFIIEERYRKQDFQYSGLPPVLVPGYILSDIVSLNLQGTIKENEENIKYYIKHIKGE